MKRLSVSEVEEVPGGVNENLTTSGLVITILGAVGATVAAIVAAPIAIASCAALVSGGTAMARDDASIVEPVALGRVHDCGHSL